MTKRSDEKAEAEVKRSRPQVITEQHHRDACDINKIVQRWRAGGPPLEFMRRKPRYGDFTKVDDYVAQLNKVKAAESEFNELPAKTRAKFEHRLENALTFMADPANHEECIELGLIDPATPPPIMFTKPVDPEAAEPEDHSTDLPEEPKTPEGDSPDEARDSR